MEFINQLLQNINQIVEHYTFDAYQQLISHNMLLFESLLALYFAWFGWSVLRGIQPLTAVEAGWHVLKVAVVFVIATNWDYYASIFVNLCIQGPDYFINDLIYIDSDNGEALTQGVAKNWQTGMEVFNKIWRNTSWRNIGGMVAAFIGYGIVTTLTVVALFFIIMAKIILSLLLVIGPLMLFALLWPSSQALFNGWLRAVIKWALTPILMYGFIGLFINIIEQQIEMMAAKLLPSTADISGFTLLGLIVIATFRQAPVLAAEIAGSVALPNALQMKNFRHWLKK